VGGEERSGVGGEERSGVGGEERSGVGEDNRKEYIGGMSVTDYLQKLQPLKDSKSYSFFNDLIVPVGLLYQPTREEETRLVKDENEEEASYCENYDRLFYLSGKDLGKSNTARKTRKKITA
jgi:hypothetical protein